MLLVIWAQSPHTNCIQFATNQEAHSKDVDGVMKIKFLSLLPSINLHHHDDIYYLVLAAILINNIMIKPIWRMENKNAQP